MPEGSAVEAFHRLYGGGIAHVFKAQFITAMDSDCNGSNFRAIVPPTKDLAMLSLFQVREQRQYVVRLSKPETLQHPCKY
jgi:hypothetical protein